MQIRSERLSRYALFLAAAILAPSSYAATAICSTATQIYDSVQNGICSLGSSQSHIPLPWSDPSNPTYSYEQPGLLSAISSNGISADGTWHAAGAVMILQAPLNFTEWSPSGQYNVNDYNLTYPLKMEGSWSESYTFTATPGDLLNVDFSYLGDANYVGLSISSSAFPTISAALHNPVCDYHNPWKDPSCEDTYLVSNDSDVTVTLFGDMAYSQIARDGYLGNENATNSNDDVSVERFLGDGITPDPIPEPATLLLTVPAGALLVARRIRLKRI